MYAVSTQTRKLSPICMNFHEWWIYDLKPFHSFWKEKIQEEQKRKPADVFIGTSAWEAILKAEKISFFSELHQLQHFSLKYHLFFANTISHHQIESVFSHFHRLGLTKVGHLRKIPRLQMQKRFGKIWAIFFEGVLNPTDSIWIWKKHTEEEIIQKTWTSDDCIIHAEPILENSILLLQEISNKQPTLFIEKLEIELSSFDCEEDQSLDFHFPHQPELKKNIPWLRRIIEERLQNLKLHSPISKLSLYLKPGKFKKQIQLNLFQSQSQAIQWKELCERLQTQNFIVFQPEVQNSHLPEKSWKKSFPKQEVLDFCLQHQLRPLIQYPPIKISPPDGKIYFIERIHCFDETGLAIQRDYFLFYFKRKWRWIFEDENKNWFEQGIAE